MNIYPLDIITIIEPTTGIIRFLNGSETLNIQILSGDIIKKINQESDYNSEYSFRIISDLLKKRVSDILCIEGFDDNVEAVFISINQDYFKNSTPVKIESFKPTLLDFDDYEQLNLFANWLIYDYADKFEYFHNTYDSLPDEVKSKLFKLRLFYLAGFVSSSEMYNQTILILTDKTH